jgi:hypothetical protein
MNSDRSRRPVFVMGCHRSGTNFLYDTLLSAGEFAVFRGYLPIYKILIPRFGDPRKPQRRARIVDAFLRSKGFARTGLRAADLSSNLLEHFYTGGDFLRIVMGEVAANQGVKRWAVYDPDSVLHVPRIKADIPDALFVHIIRDGRDVALSLTKMGGFRPFPWNRQARGLLETALYWQWMVRAGRQHGRTIPSDYVEIRYEDLVTQPHSTLASLKEFLQHDLDFERIKSAGMGSLRQPNSSFTDEGPAAQDHPIYRWKEKLSVPEISTLEALIGLSLEEFGYSLTTTAEQRRLNVRQHLMAAAYPLFLDTKLWLKMETPLGRFANSSALEMAGPPETT